MRNSNSKRSGNISSPDWKSRCSAAADSSVRGRRVSPRSSAHMSPSVKPTSPKCYLRFSGELEPSPSLRYTSVCGHTDATLVAETVFVFEKQFVYAINVSCVRKRGNVEETFYAMFLQRRFLVWGALTGLLKLHSNKQAIFFFRLSKFSKRENFILRKFPVIRQNGRPLVQLINNFYFFTPLFTQKQSKTASAFPKSFHFRLRAAVKAFTCIYYYI